MKPAIVSRSVSVFSSYLLFLSNCYLVLRGRSTLFAKTSHKPTKVMICVRIPSEESQTDTIFEVILGIFLCCIHCTDCPEMHFEIVYPVSFFGFVRQSPITSIVTRQIGQIYCFESNKRLIVLDTMQDSVRDCLARHGLT
jgi:hypothetical protein